MALDSSAYQRAVGQLSKALARHHGDPSDEEVRDAVIQRFKYAYDLATRMMRRALSEGEDTPGETDRLTFPALIRTAWEKDLIKGSYPEWQAFRESRSKTSQAYDEARAGPVVAEVPAFLDEARFLLQRLEAMGSS